MKGSIKLGQIHKPSSHKLQSNSKPCHSRNTIFLVYGRDSNPALTPMSGTDAMIPRRFKIWPTQPGSTLSSPSHCQENTRWKFLQNCPETTDREPPSFKIDNRVYFKNKQPGKLDLKWKPGYSIVCIEHNWHYLHIENQATGKTRSCISKDVVLKPPVELWNIDVQFGRAGRYIKHPANLPTVMHTH